MAKRIKGYAVYIGLKNIVWMGLLSCICCFCFFTKVNALVSNIVGKETVTVSVPQSGAAYIMGVNGKAVNKEIYDAAVYKDNCEYYDAVETGNTYNLIVVEGGADII